MKEGAGGGDSLYQAQLLGGAPRFTDHDWQEMGGFIYKALNNLAKAGVVTTPVKTETELKKEVMSAGDVGGRPPRGLDYDFDPLNGGHGSDRREYQALPPGMTVVNTPDGAQLMSLQEFHSSHANNLLSVAHIDGARNPFEHLDFSPPQRNDNDPNIWDEMAE